MIRNFPPVLAELSESYHAQGKCVRFILLILLALAVMGGVAYALKPAPPPDLAEGHFLRRSELFSLWDKGEVVVLLRHAERCDRSSNPCLAQADGITVKGQTAAIAIGHSLRTLGLDQTDVFNSPLRRTEQTSTSAFNRSVTGQDWLINCRTTLLEDMLKHKLDQRNLVLVTHSECINALQKMLNVPSPVSMGYGSALIVSVDPKNHLPRVLGFIDADDWKAVLSRRP